MPRKEKPNQRYAFSYHAVHTSEIEYAGRVVRETDDSIEINCWDAADLLFFGLPVETGELQVLPRERCRMFDSVQATADAFAEARRATRSPRALADTTNFINPFFDYAGAAALRACLE